MSTCPQCQAELNYKKGFSEKKQKPWEGNFCPNKACGYVEWLRAGQPAPQGEKQYQTQPNTNDLMWEAVQNIHKIVMATYKMDLEIYKSLIQKNGTKFEVYTTDDRAEKGDAFTANDKGNSGPGQQPQ